MKEYPINFKTDMVAAILDGRKTMARRVIKPQPIEALYDLKQHSGIPDYWIPYAQDRRVINNNIGNRKDDCGYYCPYGQAGTRLWVRETWAAMNLYDDFKPRDIPANSPIWYKGTDVDMPSGCGDDMGKVRSSRFMCKWMSRTLLGITNIRVERLNAMTESDAHAEGVESVLQFASLWDTINKARGYSWDSNPWCWCISFRRI